MLESLLLAAVTDKAPQYYIDSSRLSAWPVDIFGLMISLTVQRHQHAKGRKKLVRVDRLLTAAD